MDGARIERRARLLADVRRLGLVVARLEEGRQTHAIEVRCTAGVWWYATWCGRSFSHPAESVRRPMGRDAIECIQCLRVFDRAVLEDRGVA